eukprot:TCONS_00066213-protein
MNLFLVISLLFGYCFISVNCLSLASIAECQDIAPSELCHDCIRYSHVCRRSCHVCSAHDEETNGAEENRLDIFRREILKRLRNDRISRILRRDEDELENAPSKRRDLPARYACSITGDCHKT